MQPDPARERGDGYRAFTNRYVSLRFKELHDVFKARQQTMDSFNGPTLQDMKRAIGVTLLFSVAAELPHKGTRPGTETMTACEGAEGLRKMLLLLDHSKYNLEASAAYIADQKAHGSAARVDLEKTQMAAAGLAKLKNHARQMTTMK
ncbi:TPA: hypothetical protein ACH3X2_010545 [Trebouxia sp. C0005]